MTRKVFAVILAIVLLASSIGVPVAEAGKPVSPSANPDVTRLVPGGTGSAMSIQEFLAKNPGNIPHALEKFATTPVEVIVELNQKPLAALVAQASKTSAPMAAAAQQAYVRQLEQAQAPIAASVKAQGGMVFGQFTKAYNGIHIRIAANKVADIARLPGVVAVHRANRYEADLTHSVPLINADKVWNDPSLKFTGKGVTVAVIDTGIDFTHVALGGSGNPADYLFQAANNTVITGTVFNAKVIWGYDFAGPNYGTTGIPVPDPNPIDGQGHGTHVASTIAGLGSVATGKGVAPDAQLYAVKVFGDDGGSTSLVPEAIDWALDPNQDGIIDDHANVINMSLGSAWGPDDPVNDPDIVMTNYASAIGIVVVTSTGNSGNYKYAAGSPGNADSAVATAASADGFLTGPGMEIVGSPLITQTNVLYTPSDDVQVTSFMTGTLAYAGKLAGAPNDQLCSTAGLAANALLGKIALIQRGTCSFAIKVGNAEILGAKAAIVFNNAANGNTMVSMLLSGFGLSIPGVFIWNTSGLNLAKADGQVIAIQPFDTLTPVSVVDPAQPVDSIASFSSRGPRGYDSKLKPEITAPGLNIYAAGMGTGQAGLSLSGTSMASPHVAGVAALLRQEHPTWSSEMIKANIMNTAQDVQVLVGPNTYASGLDIARNGAGRVDAEAAAKASTVAVGDLNLVTLNWGFTPISGASLESTKFVKLINLGPTAKTYTVTVSSDSFSFTTGITVTVPLTVSVEGNRSANVPVHVSINSAKVASVMDAEQLEEYAGLVNFTNRADANDEVRLPYYIVPRPYSHVVVDSQSAPGASNASAVFASVGAIGPYNTVNGSAYAIPMMFHLPADRNATPAGDLRALGMDYYFHSATNGDVLLMTYNSYGDWHVQQTYFVEFDTYFDTNFDGNWDYVTFNWNSGSATGAPRNGQYITALVNLSTNAISMLPYLTFSDYNAGFLEQLLPVRAIGLNDKTVVGGKSSFAYQVIGFGANGYGKAAPVKEYTYRYAPLAVSLTGNQVDFGVNQLESFNMAKPAGVMLVDYNGQPGAGQVVTVDYNFAFWMHVFAPFLSNVP